MDMFDFKEGRLFCEEVDVNTIAEQVGTPVFIYSAGTILDHFDKVDRAWADVPHFICYAVKANSNIAVLSLLANRGAGMEVVSQGELFRSLRAGADPQKIVFTGVGKTVAEIEYALRHDMLLFVVESLPELLRLNDVAAALGKTARFAIRLNPDVDPHTHAHITTGKAVNKFGLDPDSAIEAYERAKDLSNVVPAGIHMHIGSQILSSQPYIEAVQKMLAVLERLDGLGITMEYLDLGGGMGVIYGDEQPRTADELIGEIKPLVKDLGMTIIMEPGRFVVGNAGILVTQVQYVKKTPVKNFVVVDAGMNDLIRPALYGAYHRILSTRNVGPETLVADIVGPVCESGDTFAKERKIPAVRSGDCLAIMTAGAYAACMSSEYNSRPKCPEVLVRGDQFFTIRQRATLDNLLSNEEVPDFLLQPSPEKT